MKTVVIVQARMTSTRLPGKIMMPLGDKTALGQCLSRCKRIKGIDEVCCAIPFGHEHDILIDEIKNYQCTVFRGSELNVLERYYQAALYLRADIIMRITSDCPLINPEVCQKVLETHIKTGADYTCNNKPPSWPHGYDCEVFGMKQLKEALRYASTTDDFEHVSTWMRNNLTVTNVPNPNGNEYNTRLTLDTKEDYEKLFEMFCQLEAASPDFLDKAQHSAEPVVPYLSSSFLARDETAGYRGTRPATENPLNIESEQFKLMYTKLNGSSVANSRRAKALALVLAKDDEQRRILTCYYANSRYSAQEPIALAESNPKYAIFRFEASNAVGAGHAIRSGVLADALVAQGWTVDMVTSAETVAFIKALSRFTRIDPDAFYRDPLPCDLLVVDNYDLDAAYEKHFRSTSKKIMVIDDLVNRPHDCDVLLDQTYKRNPDDYKPLVPAHCTVLAGTSYALLRSEFAQLRPKALEKRRNTSDVNRILISMGGCDSQNFTLRALELIKEAGFLGAIDVVLGFQAPNEGAVRTYIKSLPNECTLHVNADMPTLMYNADFAIGAAGSSIWERCCLGLPQYLFQVADNQSEAITLFTQSDFKTMLDHVRKNYQEYTTNTSPEIDGLGYSRVLCHLSKTTTDLQKLVSA